MKYILSLTFIVPIVLMLTSAQVFADYKPLTLKIVKMANGNWQIIPDREGTFDLTLQGYASAVNEHVDQRGATWTDRLDRHDRGIKDINTKITTLETKVRTLEGKVKTLEEGRDLTDLENKVRILEERMDSAQNKICRLANRRTTDFKEWRRNSVNLSSVYTWINKLATDVFQLPSPGLPRPLPPDQYPRPMFPVYCPPPGK